jgi:hypothetical protein
MMLDDVYGPNEDEFPLEQEAEEWDEETLGLEWEESEVQAIRDEVAGMR